MDESWWRRAMRPTLPLHRFAFEYAGQSKRVFAKEARAISVKYHRNAGIDERTAKHDLRVLLALRTLHPDLAVDDVTPMIGTIADDPLLFIDCAQHLGDPIMLENRATRMLNGSDWRALYAAMVVLGDRLTEDQLRPLLAHSNPLVSRRARLIQQPPRQTHASEHLCPYEAVPEADLIAALLK